MSRSRDTADQINRVDSSAANSTAITIDSSENVAFGANATFGDNDKAVFGAGSDLQIYAASGVSFIKESGAGNLNVNAANFIINNADDSQNMFKAKAGAEVELYHNNAPKLATSATGIDVTGNATFADNGKAIFGAGSDLQIYHDGNHSRIVESGGGDIIIQGDEFALMNVAGNEYMIFADNDSFVKLYYNGAAKLATTATGIDVTGTVLADGLTVETASASKITVSENTGTGTASIDFVATAAYPKTKIVTDIAGGSLSLETLGNDRLKIAHNGDISFYEDTGTTPKFFWDSSAESLNIRTTSSGSAFELNGNGRVLAGNFLQFNRTDNSTGAKISNGGAGSGLIFNELNSEGFKFQSNGSDNVVIDASGNVDIGSTNGSTKLSIAGGVGTQNGTEAAPTHTFYSDLNTGMYRPAADHLGFSTGGSEAMRIDSSGNLLVGTTTEGTWSANNSAILRPSGVSTFTSTSTPPLYANRLSTDGTILDLRKDGTTVGSIASRAGAVSTIILDPRTPTASAGAGLGTTSAKIVPADTSGLTDGKSDLGDSGNRFKDGHFSGTVNAANFNTTSDATLKTNVETLTGSLDKVKSLRGVSYDWIESGGSEIGVIAQEVEAVLPDVVSTNDEGIKSVKYGNMVAVLIEAIKEQQVRIEALELKLGE